MQRLIGALLILTATGGAGYVYGKELQNYLRKILYLRYIMNLIRGEISYTHAPLPEVFSSVSTRIKEPYSQWLLQTAEALENRDESGFMRIWCRCIDRGLAVLNLKEEHILLLKEPGSFLSEVQSERMDEIFLMYLNKLDLEIEKIRGGLSARKRIGGCLGIMSGIFLIVILL